MKSPLKGGTTNEEEDPERDAPGTDWSGTLAATEIYYLSSLISHLSPLTAHLSSLISHLSSLISHPLPTPLPDP
jgi:hypothetical protein